MHVGAVEQWVALTDHGHQATVIEVGGHVTCGGVVERADGIAIGCFVPRQLGRHRKRKRQFADAGLEIACGDGPRVAGVAGLGEMYDHVGLFQHAHRLERNQLGIARSNADADEFSGRAHMPALASALTAAAVIALPPIRPSTVRNGTPRGSAANASFASAAPTKPTGLPRMAERFGAPASSMSSKRNKAVGALPIATKAPPRRSCHKSSAAAERVV